jgi:PHD/YefM family antitoxin component YafN of YafNO toxin-antitoxin module
MSGSVLDITEARKAFNTLDERLRVEPVIWVTRHNRKAFAVVDKETLEAVLETMEILKDPESLRVLAQSIDDIKNGRLIDHDELEKEFG